MLQESRRAKGTNVKPQQRFRESSHHARVYGFSDSLSERLDCSESHNHSHSRAQWREWSEVCVGVPGATGPVCSADGEGGGEGGKLAESSTAKGKRERETAGRQDVDGRTQ